MDNCIRHPDKKCNFGRVPDAPSTCDICELNDILFFDEKQRKKKINEEI